MQINRLFEIIYILLNKERVTSKELAEKFEVSTRTIYRDIETLSSSGIPIYMSKGKNGGISLLSNFVLDKAVLTNLEKEEILASLNAVNSVNLSDTDTALRKLNSLFGSKNTDWVEVDFSSWANAETEKSNFNNIKASILGKKIIKFNYSSGRGEDTSRKVEPLKLCFKGQAWYLYGYCKTREEFRFFKIRRIKDLEVLDKCFDREIPIQIFTDDNSFREEYTNLKLRLSPKMAFRVYDEFNDFEKLEDGSFICKILYPKSEFIFNYIASFGEECEVLEPQDLRCELRGRLERVLEKYT